MNSIYLSREYDAEYKLFDFIPSRQYKGMHRILSSWRGEGNSCEIADALRNWKVALSITPRDESVLIQQSETERTFCELAETWRQETALLSSVTMMAMHPAYQRIIGMGKKVIPLIMRELQKNPDHWFWALNAITGENPVDPADAGDIAKMSEAWLEYGKLQGYVP